MSRTRARLHFGFLLAVLFAVPVSAWGEVFALPVSDKLLKFEVTVQVPKEVSRDGEKVKVYVPAKFGVVTREGTLFQIQGKGGGPDSYWFGFIANLDKTGAVTLSQFGIESPKPKVHNATGPFHQNMIKRGTSANFLGAQGKLSVNIRFVEVRDGSFPDAPAYEGSWDNADERQMESLRLIYGDPSQSICCVGCGPLRVCANEVSIPGCGTCGGGGVYTM